MAEPILGRKKILMFRNLKDMATKNAAKLALQTSHTLTYERSTDITQTKDGPITSDGALEVTLSIEAIATDDEVNKILADSVKNGDILEIREIDRTKKNEEGEYPAKYMRGRLGSWEMPSEAEEYTTISTEASIDGEPQDGFVTLTEEQENEIKYAFHGIEAEPVTP